MCQIHTLENLRSERVCQPSGFGRKVHFALYHAAEPPFNPTIQVGTKDAINAPAAPPKLSERQGSNAATGKHEQFAQVGLARQMFGGGRALLLAEVVPRRAVVCPPNDGG